MSVPQLNRRLVLEALDRVADGAGGFAETWVARGTLWAAMTPRTGRVRDGGALSLSLMRWKITVRGAPAGAPSRPVPGQRFREGARAFVIEAVAEHDPAGRYLTCFATEESVT